MVSENKDKMKDLFSAKLNGFEPELPASFWSGIDQSLSQQPPLSAPSASASTVTKTMFWLKAVAAAACVTALVVVGTIFIQSDSEEPVMVQSLPPVEKNIESDATSNAIIADETPLLASVSTPPMKTEKQVRSTQVKAQIATSNKVEEVIGDKSTPEKKDEIPYFDKKSTDKKKTIEDYFLKQEDEIEILAPLSKTETLAMGFNANSGMLSSNSSQKGGVMSFVQASAADKSLYYGDNTFEMDHQQPISFGMTVSKGITSNLSVETGIRYTFLSSDIKSSDTYISKEKQTFHYLGIPLSLNYTFFRYRKLNAYASLGGMVQKDIKGTYKGSITRAYPGESILGTGNTDKLELAKTDIKQDNPQFSAHLTVGVSYPIYSRLYLYGTIGGAYYFDADNKYRTIYSDRDTQLDLNLGLKWNF